MSTIAIQLVRLLQSRQADEPCEYISVACKEFGPCCQSQFALASLARDAKVIAVVKREYIQRIAMVEGIER